MLLLLLLLDKTCFVSFYKFVVQFFQNVQIKTIYNCNLFKPTVNIEIINMVFVSFVVAKDDSIMTSVKALFPEEWCRSKITYFPVPMLQYCNNQNNTKLPPNNAPL